MNKKVILLTLCSKGGGAERVLSHLANYLCSCEYNVTYAYFRDMGFYNLNTKINLVKFNSGIYSSIRSLRRYLKKHEYSTIISFGFPTSIRLYFSLFLIRSKYTIICSERNDPERNINSRFKDILRSLAYASSDYVVFQTIEAKSYFSKKIQKKGVIILNPIIRKLPTDRVKKENRLIGVGRITSQKNFSLLIDAFYSLSIKYSDLSLVIYGNANSSKEYQLLIKQIQDLKLNERIEIRPFTDNILNEMKKSRIYVSTSNYEGISNSMLEAMLVGMPVVCTDCPCGGARAIIDDGENGFLFPVGDKNALISKLELILTNQNIEKKLSRKSREIKEKLSIEKIGNKWIQLIQRKD